MEELINQEVERFDDKYRFVNDIKHLVLFVGKVITEMQYIAFHDMMLYKRFFL